MTILADPPTIAPDRKRVDVLVDELLAAYPPERTDPVTFLGAQFDAGLGWVHFPVGAGGLGASADLHKHVQARLAAAGAPSAFDRNPIGYGMGGPTVLTYGSQNQRRRYLRPLFSTEEIWCQLFSEPGAGSDVAALATSAVRDGDEWLLNGQKVWTTLGHVARWALLLARTDPSAPKHRGLTYFVLDMHAPGVDVRPLRQMTGEAEFNEVFLSDVRIADSERLGEVGAGWRVAMTTLSFERGNLGDDTPKGGGPIALATNLWAARQDHDSSEAAVLRDRLARLWIRAEVARLTDLRAAATRVDGDPGPAGSVGKLEFGQLNQAIFELCVDLQGAAGMLYPSYEMVRPAQAGFDLAHPARCFLRSQANSIEGGTSNIMRNILGERVLGLPLEAREDRDRPWNGGPP